MFRFVSSFLVLFLAIPALAEGGSGNVDRLRDRFITVKPFIAISSFSAEMKDRDNGSYVKYQPNTRASIGVDLYFHGLIGVGFAGKTDMKSEDRVMKGNTDYQDWRLSSAFDHWYAAANYQQYRGFYVENSGYVDNTWSSGKPYVQEPDMTARNISGSFTWVFDPESFSASASLDQSVRQKKSGGSWLAGIAVSQTIFENGTGLIPSAVQSDFGSDAALTKAEFRSVVLRGGYGQTFLFTNSLFISVFGLIGAGPEWTQYQLPTGGQSSSRTIALIDTTASLGFNGEDYIGGVIFDGNNYGYQTASIDINASLFSLKFYFGMRF